MKIESYIKRGNSFPIIIDDKGIKYFVKLRAGMSGKYGLLNEWIGCKLGQELGVNTQNPEWIELNDNLNTGDIYIEVKELINKSFGLNIGFEYKNDALEIAKYDFEEFDKKDLNRMFLFDLLMVNIDRTESNLNMIKVKDKLISIDYESSFLVQEIIENRILFKNKQILQSLRNNPLCQNIDEEEINDFIESTRKINITEMLINIPKVLLTEDNRTLFIEGFEERKRNDWFLKEILNYLKNMNIQSEIEQNNRAKKNEIKFRKRFN